MKTLFYGEVRGSHIPPSQQPINQQFQRSPAGHFRISCSNSPSILHLRPSATLRAAVDARGLQSEEVSSEVSCINW